MGTQRLLRLVSSPVGLSNRWLAPPRGWGFLLVGADSRGAEKKKNRGQGGKLGGFA